MVKITERTVRDGWRRSNGYKETQDKFRINVFPLERESRQVLSRTFPTQ
jgi:hypothetical protein